MKNFFFLFLLLVLSLDLSQQQRRSPQTGSGLGGGSGATRRSTTPPPTRNIPSKIDEDEELDDDTFLFNCPKSDGLFADPSSCKRFYLCGGFHAYSQACPPSLYFDDKLKFCTFKTAQLQCGPIEEDEEQEKALTNQDKLTVCDKQTCKLPNCFCSDEGTSIPGDLNPNQTPQFILLGFSGGVNELVFDQYKKILGYNSKYNVQQSKINPGGCGIRGTFFINHEYANYAEIQWLATQGHEIALHSITHRLPELWWTDTANYSEWAEEMIGMREILLKFANGGTNNGILSRDSIVGMRSPYVKPGGDPMFEMAHDFGLIYDSSIVAPRGSIPYWPFTFDHRQPFDCSGTSNTPSGNKANEESENLDTEGRSGRGAPVSLRREKREEKPLKFLKKKIGTIYKSKLKNKTRIKRNSPYLGRPLKCPTKPYPGLWEIPLNPLFNEFNTCPHADQCVFPSADETDDTSDIIEFLKENFDRHYNSNRAPFLLNFHVNWFTSKTKVRAVNKFIDNILKEYKDVYFVTYQQLIHWMRDPKPVGQLELRCENKTHFSTCNRPHTCVVRHLLDKNNNAATEDNAVRRDTRYMPVCHPTSCPQLYPWYGNHAGAARNFKTIMQLVDEALVTDEKQS